MEKQIRPLNEEEQKEFKEADRKFDKIMTEDKKRALQGSKIELRKKTFMKISDVDTEDAMWFKRFCDTHTDRKQFLGIKVMRAIIDSLDPLVKNVLTQINSLTSRIDSIEARLNEPPTEESNQLPKTQGSKKK